jgi:hypothetical protein
MFIILITMYIILSAIANAIADRLENLVAFNDSVFYKRDPKFWCKEISWQYARKIFSYKIDAWHLAESFQVLILLVALLMPLLRLKLPGIHGLRDLLLLYMALGAIYNIIFLIFYNRILKRKPDGNKET